MAVKNYIVTLADSSLERMTSLAQQLRDAGFTVTRQLDAIGVICLSADEALVPRLRDMSGVTAVEEERTYAIPPPDSDIA